MGAGGKSLLQQRSGAERKNFAVRGLYCRRSEARSESEKNFVTNSVPSATERAVATEGSDFSKKRGEVEVKLDRCKRFS